MRLVARLMIAPILGLALILFLPALGFGLLAKEGVLWVLHLCKIHKNGEKSGSDLHIQNIQNN